MENDDEMQRVIETVVSHFLACSRAKPVSIDEIVPPSNLPTDFFENLIYVTGTKKQLIYDKWGNFCTISYFNALSTHEMYLRYVMFACDFEARLSDNIFEKLLSVFALVLSYNYETLISSGVNFCKLTVDILMVYYKNTLKESFFKEGGFEQFAEYLRHHDYLPWGSHKHDHPDTEIAFSKRASPLKQANDKTEKEIENVPCNPNLITHLDVTKNAHCKSLAKEVLSTTKTRLPTLVNLTDLKYQMQEARRLKAAVGHLHWTVETVFEDETASKREKAGKSSKCEALKGVSKCKVTKGVSKCKARKRILKCKSTKEVSKSEAVKEVAVEGASKLESDDTTLKLESSDTTSKDERTETFEKSETTETASECEELKGVSKCKARKRILKCKSAKEVSKSEAVKKVAMEGASELDTNDTTSRDVRTEPFEKSETTESVSKYETTEAALKRETTNATSELKDWNRKEKETSSNREATERVSDQCTNTKSDVQERKEAEVEINLDWCEDIVRRVIKYNNSKRSDSANPNNRIQRELDKFVKQMKDIVKSLIDVLEELYEECEF